MKNIVEAFTDGGSAQKHLQEIAELYSDLLRDIVVVDALWGIMRDLLTPQISRQMLPRFAGSRVTLIPVVSAYSLGM